MEKFEVLTKMGITTVKDSIGRLHSFDGKPSLIDPRGTAHWHCRDVLHREDGPAIDGRHVQMWYRHGKIHRDGDEPAIYEDQGRRVMYYKEDRPHRVFGPAVIEITKVGKEVQYWINGQKYSDEDTWEAVAVHMREKERASYKEVKPTALLEDVENAFRGKKRAKNSETVEEKVAVEEVPIVDEVKEEAVPEPVLDTQELQPTESETPVKEEVSDAEEKPKRRRKKKE